MSRAREKRSSEGPLVILKGGAGPTPTLGRGGHIQIKIMFLQPLMRSQDCGIIE